MNIINPQQLFDLVISFPAVIIDNNALVVGTYSDWENKLNNEILFYSWNHEGREFCCKFIEENFHDARIEGNQIVLPDSEGIDTTLILLEIKNLHDYSMNKSSVCDYFIHMPR